MLWDKSITHRDGVLQDQNIPLRYMCNGCGSHCVTATTYRHQTREAIRTVHGKVPGPVATHAEAGHVDAVEIDVVGLDDFIEKSGEHTVVPPVAEIC